MSKEDKVVVDIFGGCCGRKVGEESGRDGGSYRERLSEKLPKTSHFRGKNVDSIKRSHLYSKTSALP